MNKGITLTVLFLLIGCGSIDPTAAKINSSKQFEAEYATWTSSTVTFRETETDRQIIKAKVKGDKFYFQVYRNFLSSDNLAEEVIYDGKTLWLVTKSMGGRFKDIVVYQPMSTGQSRALHFWKLPQMHFSKPTEENQYYVYKAGGAFRGGNTDISIYVDKKDYVVKKAKTALYISDMVDEPYSVDHLECKSIVFKEIPDTVFDYKPAPNAEVKTSAEAIRGGMDAFKDLLTGKLK